MCSSKESPYYAYSIRNNITKQSVSESVSESVSDTTSDITKPLLKRSNAICVSFYTPKPPLKRARSAPDAPRRPDIHWDIIQNKPLNLEEISRSHSMVGKKLYFGDDNDEIPGALTLSNLTMCNSDSDTDCNPNNCSKKLEIL